MKGSAKAKAVALVAAGVVAGGVLAGTLSATAATSGTATRANTPPATGGYAPPAGAPQAGSPPMGARPTGQMRPGGAQPVRSDEKLVTGSDLDTLKAAASKAVPGGTIIRVETDSGDATYEAHMTKADGSLATVKFDKRLAVTSVEEGMGK